MEGVNLNKALHPGSDCLLASSERHEFFSLGFGRLAFGVFGFPDPVTGENLTLLRMIIFKNRNCGYFRSIFAHLSTFKKLVNTTKPKAQRLLAESRPKDAVARKFRNTFWLNFS